MNKVNFGEGKITSLKVFLELEKPKKVLLLHGSKSFESLSGSIDNLIPCPYENFVVTESFISFDMLLKGLEFYKNTNSDCIICIGGGTIIDFGKLISIFSANPGSIIDYASANKNFRPRNNLLIALPTTSGSGSEATHFAVLHNGLTKYSIADKSLLPDYAIIDPELTYSLSPYQTAVSGIDALCQGIESFWSLQSNSESREYSREAISLVLKNIETAVIEPTRLSRLNMSRGSHFAGKAINIAKTTAAHAFSYPLTKLFDVPHGHAVSLTIGKFYEHNCTGELYNKNFNPNTSLKSIMSELNQIMNVENCNEAKMRLTLVMSNIGLDSRLPETVHYRDSVSDVIENVNIERLSNNPVKVTTDDLINIFKSLVSV